MDSGLGLWATTQVQPHFIFCTFPEVYLTDVAPDEVKGTTTFSLSGEASETDSPSTAGWCQTIPAGMLAEAATWCRHVHRHRTRGGCFFLWRKCKYFAPKSETGSSTELQGPTIAGAGQRCKHWTNHLRVKSDGLKFFWNSMKKSGNLPLNLFPSIFTVPACPLVFLQVDLRAWARRSLE